LIIKLTNIVQNLIVPKQQITFIYVRLLYSQLSSKIYILFIYSAPDDNDDGDGVERSCETLIMCIITTLNNGLRNGGGIGDVLRKPSSSVRNKLSHLFRFFSIYFIQGTTLHVSSCL
jgi:hypothetical protein